MAKTVTMDETAVLVNPAAGGGRAGRTWERLLAAVPELAAARRIGGDGAEEARAELAAARESGVRRLIAVGGDGTAHLAANALLASGRGQRVAFGLVGAGTGSDLARSLGLPRRPEAALRHLLAAEPRPLDAIEVRTAAGAGCYAVNTATAGLSGEVVLAINANPRRGQLSYLAATLKGVLRYRPAACRVEVDGEELFDGDCFLAAVANGQYFGNGMHLAPEARLDDGLLDVVVAPTLPLWHLPYRLPQFLTGRHLKLPIVRFRQARRVRIEPRAEPGAPVFPPYEVDGESLPSGPAEIRVLPAALRVLA